ncbi:MAG TPA: P63C domain-containing protein [Azospirillum sp.]
MPDLFGNEDTPQSKGGKARAEALSPDDRQKIARKAAQKRWEGEAEILRATHDSSNHPLMIGGQELPCYVLEDGRRVLSLGGMVRLMGMSGGSASRREGDRLVNFATGKAVSPFISNELLSRMKEPVRFRAPSGGTVATGYEATILPDLCDAVLEARKAGLLRKDQMHIAVQCEILVRALARVGIIALVDEATGYQELRDRKALEEIVNRYITEELRRWTKTFPDDYFTQIFRLKGWRFPSIPTKRPGVLGYYTRDIVYARLAPGVLEELEKKNPSEGGRRKHKHFQFLTEDYGDPRLREHLTGVIALMKGSRTWDQFRGMLQRVYPKVNSTLELPLDVPPDDNKPA